jgi:hypothetical protein
MTISRMQQPRQQYGLGSIVKKAVKGVSKGIKKFAKSNIGKAALLYAGGAGLGALGAGSAGTGFGLKMFGPKAFASNLGMSLGKLGLGSKFVGPSKPGLFGLTGSQAALGIGAASTLAGILASDPDMTEDQAEELKQDPVALRNYLSLYYSNLNPNASKEEVESFVRTNMYATGGRVGYGIGGPGVQIGGPPPLGSPQGSSPLYQNVLQYLQRGGKQAKQAKPTTPVAFKGTSGGRGFVGLEPGGIDDPRSIALTTLGQLGYDTKRFMEFDDPPPSMSAGPQRVGSPGSMPNITFKDEETLQKLMNPAFDFQQGTYIDTLKEAKDIGRDYTIDEILKLNKEDIMEIADLYNKKNKYGKYTPIKSAALTTYTGPTNFTYGGGQTGSATPFNQGGRVGYRSGDVVDQASGIMGLPKRVNKAGVKELDLRESGGFIPPVGVKEKADDIPAMLSNNEFVFTADAVRGMGNGNVNKGAQRMYDMMKKLEEGGRV